MLEKWIEFEWVKKSYNFFLTWAVPEKIQCIYITLSCRNGSLKSWGVHDKTIWITH